MHAMVPWHSDQTAFLRRYFGPGDHPTQEIPQKKWDLEE